MTGDVERTHDGEQPRQTESTRTDEKHDGPVGGSSRQSLTGAGWTCRKIGRFRGMVTPESRSFSWLSLAPLWRSRNQVIGTLLGDPTDDERRRWMENQRKAGKLQPDLVIKEHADLKEFSFLVVGDTGEGDASQFAVVPPMLEAGKGTAFMVICSDVIYPSGDAEDYEEKFYRPYENYPNPIYALPGNHDWYDGLNGFMYHLCDAEASTAQGRSPELVTSGTDSKRALLRETLRRRLWRKPSGMEPTVPIRKQVWRSLPSQRSSQRSPYFAIETGPLLIVGIDTGMGGGIDCEQGEWLRKVSRIDKQKILLTGKPIYVDGEYHPGAIEDGGTVDEIVRDPEHCYVAAIGGDIHNYQRYRVRMKGHTHPFYYIVSGGGGAYMSATHQIRKVSLPGIDEEDKDEDDRSCFVCYPRRGDSLSFYSKLYDRKFGLGKGWLEIPPAEASAYMGERLGIKPVREKDQYAYISRRARRLAERIFPLPGRGRGLLHHYFSEFFDWNEPPLFKHFLKLDVRETELTIRCFAATGCLDHERNPPVEDEIRIPLGPPPQESAGEEAWHEGLEQG